MRHIAQERDRKVIEEARAEAEAAAALAAPAESDAFSADDVFSKPSADTSADADLVETPEADGDEQP